MSRGALVLAAGAVALALAPSATAEPGSWEGGGPPAPVIGVLEVDPVEPTTVYGSGVSTVYVTEDGAASWRRLARPDLSAVSISALEVNPAAHRELYLHSDSDLYRSTDGGAAWTKLDLEGVSTFALLPGAPATLLAATFEHGVQRSTDGGATWTDSSDGIEDPSLVGWFAVAPSDPSVVYVFSRTLYRSSDGGRSWARASLPVEDSFPLVRAVDPSAPDTLYLADGLTVWRTTDGGVTWERRSAGLPSVEFGFIPALVAAPSQPDLLYAVTDTALYRTTNGGKSWQLVNDDAFGTVSPWTIAIDPADSLRVYRASGQGVFVSTDGGVTFSPANRGLPGLAMHAVAAGADGTVVASPLYGGVYASADGGQTWRGGLGEEVEHEYVESLAVEAGGRAYAGTYQGSLFRSANGGLTWSEVGRPPAGRADLGSRARSGAPGSRARGERDRRLPKRRCRQVVAPFQRRPAEHGRALARVLAVAARGRLRGARPRRRLSLGGRRPHLAASRARTPDRPLAGRRSRRPRRALRGDTERRTVAYRQSRPRMVTAGRVRAHRLRGDRPGHRHRPLRERLRRSALDRRRGHPDPVRRRSSSPQRHGAGRRGRGTADGRPAGGCPGWGLRGHVGRRLRSAVRVRRALAWLGATLAALAVGASSLGAASLPSEGPYRITERGYDLGRQTLFLQAGGVRLHAFPTRLAGEVLSPVGARGRRPVVVFLHGAHQSCDMQDGSLPTQDWPCRPSFLDVDSFTGYRYAARILASWGFVVISIDANPVAPADSGVLTFPDGAEFTPRTWMDMRAKMVDRHLRRLARANRGEQSSGRGLRVAARAPARSVARGARRTFAWRRGRRLDVAPAGVAPVPDPRHRVARTGELLPAAPAGRPVRPGLARL